MGSQFGSMLREWPSCPLLAGDGGVASLSSVGGAPGLHPLPAARRPGGALLPHHVAPGPAPAGWPVRGRAGQTRDWLAPLAVPPPDLAAEPRRLLLPGLPVGQGEGAPGRPAGGAGAGGGPPQRLLRHAGSVSDPAGNCGIALREHQPTRHRR